MPDVLSAAGVARAVSLSCLIAGAALLSTIGAAPAWAVPAFARQTGSECTACHVGAFGPALTAFGRAFKLNGYRLGDDTEMKTVPLSGMVLSSFSQTAKPNPQPPTGWGANNNAAVDQLSIFYAGPLYDKIGALAQVTYSPITHQVGIDNTDIRFADRGTVAGRDVLYGITVNNNPTVQDPWQSTPAWGYPYVSSRFVPGYTTTMIEGALAGRVMGAGIYTMIDDLLYAEVTGYGSLGQNTQMTLGLPGAATADRLTSIAPYWRLALQRDWGVHYASVGTYGMLFSRLPGNVRGFGDDHFLDWAADATYQLTLDQGDHIVSVYATAINERQTLGASTQINGTNTRNTLTTLKASAGYTYHNLFGLTGSRFSTTGSTDAAVYSSRTGSPNTSGWLAELTAVPFGKMDSWGFPYANTRLSLQYWWYDKFLGAARNYDGNGRNASDNNTLYLSAMILF